MAAKKSLTMRALERYLAIAVNHGDEGEAARYARELAGLRGLGTGAAEKLLAAAKLKAKPVQAKPRRKVVPTQTLASATRAAIDAGGVTSFHVLLKRLHGKKLAPDGYQPTDQEWREAFEAMLGLGTLTTARDGRPVYVE